MIVTFAAFGIAALIGCAILQIPAVQRWFKGWMYDNED